MKERKVFVNGIEVTAENYGKVIGYGTALERAVDDALDAFYDCTAEDERAAGISTTGGGAKIFIIEK